MSNVNNERTMAGRRFAENEGKNVIHGCNIKAHSREIKKEIINELKENTKKIKDGILFYAIDDAGNIDIFLKVYGEYVIYNCDEQCFYIWTGRVWLKDTENRVQLWCQTVMKARRDYTLKSLRKNPSIKNYNNLMRYANNCCNQKTIRALMDGLKSALACNSSKFDKSPYLLNVLNGTIDLRTGYV